MNLFAVIPFWYKLAAAAALGAALVAFGWVKGADHEQEKAAALALKVERAVYRVAAARVVVTEKVVLKYLPAITKIQTVTETIIKEVPTYVSDNDCPMSPGFRVLHDAAAAGELPDRARIADATAVSAPAIAETVAENYGTCLENAKRLEGLQEWITEQQKVKP